MKPCEDVTMNESSDWKTMFKFNVSQVKATQCSNQMLEVYHANAGTLNLNAVVEN